MIKKIRAWIEWKDINLSEIVAICFCLFALIGFLVCAFSAIFL